MGTEARLSGQGRKMGFAAALMWTAGFVDALGYLRLAGLYVANMSGNSVGMGLHGALGELSGLLRGFAPVIGFFFGLLITVVVLDWAKRRHVAHRLVIVLALETVMLAAFALIAGPDPEVTEAHFYLLVTLGSLAMGLQNSVLLHFGALTIYTTHITGLLTRLAHAVADALFWVRDHASVYPSSGALWRAASRSAVVLEGAGLLGLWLLYVAGALIGAWCEQRWGGRGAFVACSILIAVIGVEWVAPICP